MNHRHCAVCLVAFLAGACNNGSNEGKGAPAAPASVAPSEVAPAPPPPATATAEKRGETGPGRGGVDGLLFRAARDLPLGDASKAKIAALEGELHDRDTAPRDAMQRFSTELAAEVRAGKVEASKLAPDEAAFDAAMKAMLDKQAKALASLHDTLDAGQRKTLADSVNENVAAREGGNKAGNTTASDRIARKLDRMTDDLGLDSAQQKQVGAILAKQPGATDRKKQLAAILTAFQQDSFDASSALRPTVMALREALDRQVALTTQVVPLLHPDQREKLATSTLKPSGRGGFGGSPDEEKRGE